MLILPMLNAMIFPSPWIQRLSGNRGFLILNCKVISLLFLVLSQLSSGLALTYVASYFWIDERQLRRVS